MMNPGMLVVDNITKPAFMQPPASSKKREKDYKTAVGTPDELDMLVTSKNHDLKMAVATRAWRGRLDFCADYLADHGRLRRSRQLRHLPG